jgi:hypothetical protein
VFLVFDDVVVDVSTSEGGVVSATDFRQAFGDVKAMMQFLPDHLNDATKEKVIQLLMN